MAIVGVAGALCATPVVAHAHSGGVNGGGCGCHGNGDVGIDVSVSPSSFDPGDEITVTVTVSQAGGNVAGVFIDDDDVGSYDTIGGQGLAEVAAGMTHTSPKSMSGGSASWSFNWTAPNQVGAVRFTVWGLSGNGNGSSSGDDATSEPFDFVFGCSPQEYYRDADGDGFGRTNSPLIHCQGSAPSGYAAEPGDCDDNDPDQFPTAVEYCNTVDDDCDGRDRRERDPADAVPGRGRRRLLQPGRVRIRRELPGLRSQRRVGGRARRLPPRGPDDQSGRRRGLQRLRPTTATTTSTSSCRPRCGTGWCEREAIGCDPQHCTPGEPREEECNFFDDDCDGIVDNDAPCPEGETCQAGLCRPEEEAETGGAEAGDDDDDDADGPSDGTAGGGTEGSGNTAGATDGPSGCACNTTPTQAPLAWLLLLPLIRRRTQLWGRS